MVKVYYKKYFHLGLLSLVFLLFSYVSSGQEQDTSRLPLPIPQKDILSKEKGHSPLFLDNPSNIKEEVIYDPATQQYTVYEKVGAYNIALPKVMSVEEYRRYRVERGMREYWKQKQTGETSGKGDGILPRIQVNRETFDRVFGSNTIEIIPQGSAELIFGISSTKIENPTLQKEQQKNIAFDFQSQIQMNVFVSIDILNSRLLL